MEAQTNGHPPPGRIFIFDMIRARSQLFFRWLVTNPQLGPVMQRFIMAAYMGKKGFTQYSRNNERRNRENVEFLAPFYGDDTYDSCAEVFGNDVKKIEQQGQIALGKDHWHNLARHDVIFPFIRNDDYGLSDLPKNPTHIPDWFYDSMRPILLIRNPLLQIPSHYYGVSLITYILIGDEDHKITTNLAFFHLLFDHFKAQGKDPIVVEAEDMLWRTDELAASLCKRLDLGIDPTGFKDTWEPGRPDLIPEDPVLKTWIKNLWSSTGIQRPEGKRPALELETEYHKWIERFGPMIAGHLRELVEENLPHYEYLKQFKA